MFVIFSISFSVFILGYPIILSTAICFFQVAGWVIVFGHGFKYLGYVR